MTKEIVLTKGQVALVEDSDYIWLSQWRWYCSEKPPHLKYAMRKDYDDSGKRITINMHRVITNCPQNLFVDHINGNGLDNRRSNLRIVTKRENTLNRKIQKKNSSGRVGVKKSSWKGHWEAYIRIHGKYIHLGTFTDKDLAIKARVDAEATHFGEFARKEII